MSILMSSREFQAGLDRITRQHSCRGSISAADEAYWREYCQRPGETRDEMFERVECESWQRNRVTFDTLRSWHSSTFESERAMRRYGRFLITQATLAAVYVPPKTSWWQRALGWLRASFGGV